MKPQVSVIIPTYNRVETLPRALNSVLKQKNASFEVLVVDDGSTDKTELLICEKYPSVRYIKQSRQGPSAARNKGIEDAKGEWIAFLDSDDEWLNGKLEAQLGFFKTSPDYQICQTEEIWIRNGRRVNPMKKHAKKSGLIFDACLALCLISPSAVMIHKNLFSKVGNFDETLPACEDYDLWLRITAQFPVGLIQTPYVTRYGGHEDQQSKAFPAMDRFRIQALVKILKSGVLTEAQISSATQMLQEKSRIFIEGALKRGNQNEAQAIEELVGFTLVTP